MPVTRSSRADIKQEHSTADDLRAEPRARTADEGQPGSSPTSAAVPSKMAVKRRVAFSPQSQPVVKRFRTASARHSSDQYKTQPHRQQLMTPSRAALQAGIERLEVVTPEHSSNHHGRDGPTIVNELEPDSIVADLYSASSLLTPDTPSRCKAVTSSTASKSVSIRKRARGHVHAVRALHDHATNHEIAQMGLQSLLGDADLQNLVQLQETFHRLRNALTLEMPEDAVNKPTNLEVLDICVTTIEALNARQQQRDMHDDEQAKLIRDLYTQADNLLVRLAHNEKKCTRAEKQRLELVARCNDRDDRLAALEKELQQARDTIQQLETQLSTGQVEQLAVENDELRRTSNKLKQSLHHYRAEEDRLHALITRMESEYAAVVDNLQHGMAPPRGRTIYSSKSAKSEREELLHSIDGLQHRVEAEIKRRRQAEHALGSSESEVTSLKAEINAVHERFQRGPTQHEISAANRAINEPGQNDRGQWTRDAIQTEPTAPTTPTATQRDVEWYSLLCRQTSTLKKIKRRAEEQDVTIASLRTCSRDLQRSLRRLFDQADADPQGLGKEDRTNVISSARRSQVTIDLDRMVAVLDDDTIR